MDMLFEFFEVFYGFEYKVLKMLSFKLEPLLILYLFKNNSSQNFPCQSS